jgi:hypothetical protein
MRKSELRLMIREVLKEELCNKQINEAKASKKIIYVLSTFNGKEYVYTNFDDAVEDAEGKYMDEANSIYPYYLNADGTYTDLALRRNGSCLCWTEEEGTIYPR